jgi:hypothetical protein
MSAPRAKAVRVTPLNGCALEETLAHWTDLSLALHETGHTRDAELIKRFCAEVASATEEYRRWLSEPEAILRSGRTRNWLRFQFTSWEAAGHARRDGKQRHYRMIVVPTRGAAQKPFEEGQRAGGEHAA